jgi:hypothetical protein
MNNKKNVPHFSMYIKSVLYIYCFSEVEINIIYTLLLNDAYDNCILYIYTVVLVGVQLNPFFLINQLWTILYNK